MGLKKIGGIWFFRLGALRISVCRKKPTAVRQGDTVLCTPGRSEVAWSFGRPARLHAEDVLGAAFVGGCIILGFFIGGTF